MRPPGLRVSGWSIYAHPLFLDQLEALIAAAESARAKDPERYRTRRAARLLAAVLKVAFDDIPGDPTRDAYRQGNTLGGDHRHWCRAKFLQQYRLFFRYRRSPEGSVIVLAWLNDEESLRTYGSRTDAYAVFRRMLERGTPPDDWDSLLREATATAATGRLERSTRPGRRE